MNVRRITVFVLIALLALGAMTAMADVPSVEPIYEPGNPSCTDLGYDFGFKPQVYNEDKGQWEDFDGGTGTFTFPDGVNTVWIGSDGTHVQWTSSLGIDAVIVKGGPNANVYVYDPPAESFGDFMLHSPTNPRNGKIYGLSHVEFCYDYEVTVSKTAETSFTRTFDWTINKEVTPAEWKLFPGDSGTSQYTVSVTKTGFTDSDWAVTGAITIENKTPYDATIESVTDVVSPDIGAPVDCGVAFPYTLPAWQTLTCTYNTPLPDGAARTNTATVTTSGIVGGGEATWPVTFGDPTTVVHDSITVTDDTRPGEQWTFNDTGFFTYERTFTCDVPYQSSRNHGNNATITETGQSATTHVKVWCQELQVTKDAFTSFARTYNWAIDKWADQTALTLAIGETGTVNYSVAVNMLGSTDSNWAVNGNITVTNPAPVPATINGVSDIVSGGIGATVDCGVSFPYTLAGYGTLNCTYSASLPDASFRTNTATATRQNYSYDYLKNPTPVGTTDISSAPADVDFSNATINEVDECTNVSDSFAGNLGTVCSSQTFNYSRTIGPYDVCGDYTVENIASFVTNDTGVTGSDAWTVAVTVPCPPAYEYETAFAKGGSAICFLDYDYSRWGWTNPIDPGAYTWQLWAGAGQCDTSKGTLVGTVTVVYDGANVTVTYNVGAPYTLTEQHVYAGTEMFPPGDLAPGQYQNYGPFTDGSQVYVIAHATVGIPVTP